MFRLLGFSFFCLFLGLAWAEDPTEEAGELLPPENQTTQQEAAPVVTTPAAPTSTGSLYPPPVGESAPTQILARPLTEDEKILRARQKAEQATELKIRKRLETLRLRDEQKRLNQLLPQGAGEGAVSTFPIEEGGEWSSGAEAFQAKKKESDIYRKKMSQYTPSYVSFVRLGLGGIKYLHQSGGIVSSEVRSIGLGLLEGRHVSFDAGFSYSTHRLRDEPDTQKNLFSHYNMSAVLKYFLFPGRVKPFLGVLASYNYRDYTGDYDLYYYTDEMSTQSLNIGGAVGVDAFLGSRFMIGMDARFHFNIYALQGDEIRNPHEHYFARYETTPEELNWVVFQFYLGVLF